MRRKINRQKLNLTIDIVMFVVLMGVAGIGLLIKFILVPGFKRNVMYGKDCELFFLGFDRHDWGSIHLILSFGFIFLLLLHIVFHWRMVVAIFKSMVHGRKLRIAYIFGVIIFSVLIGIMPLFVKPEIRLKNNHYSLKETSLTLDEPSEVSSDNEVQINRHHKEIIDSGSFNNNEDSQSKVHYKSKIDSESRSVEIRGNMTLNDIGAKYNVTATELAEVIHVPDAFGNERLGRLKKKYNFQLNDLRRYIEIKKNHDSIK